jgi:chromosome partitioning protein
VQNYNKYASDSGGTEWIAPKILGVLFTMIQVLDGGPISAQRQYIEQVSRLNVPRLNTFIRENKTIYADAPQYGVPVVLKRVSGQTYESVRYELQTLTTEVLGKIQPCLTRTA